MLARIIRNIYFNDAELTRTLRDRTKLQRELEVNFEGKVGARLAVVTVAATSSIAQGGSLAAEQIDLFSRLVNRLFSFRLDAVAEQARSDYR